jgi:hypothetical protein
MDVSLAGVAIVEVDPFAVMVKTNSTVTLARVTGFVSMEKSKQRVPFAKDPQFVRI